MNPKPSLLRLLTYGQFFMLGFLVLMPLVIRLLPGVVGKLLYALMVVGAVGLAILLRRALEELKD